MTNFESTKEITAVGSAVFFRNGLPSLSYGLFAKSAGLFGTDYIAASGLARKAEQAANFVIFGIAQGYQPFAAYNYGARNKQRLTTALKYGCCIAGVIMTLGAITFLTIPDVLMGMFNANDEMLEIGCVALRVICLCFIPAAIGIVFSSFYQATGHGLRSMTISMLRQLVFLVPAAYFLSNIGLNAVWFAFPIAEAGALILAITFFINLYNKEIKYIDQPDKFSFKN